MKSIIDLATQGATEMKTLSKRHIEAIEKAKTEQGKVKAAALAMIETPMELIKAVLLKHEVAVLEVMRGLHQQQQADEALLRQALEALKKSHPYSNSDRDLDKHSEAIHALRSALAEPEPRNQCGETCERAKLCAVCAGGHVPEHAEQHAGGPDGAHGPGHQRAGDKAGPEKVG